MSAAPLRRLRPLAAAAVRFLSAFGPTREPDVVNEVPAVEAPAPLERGEPVATRPRQAPRAVAGRRREKSRDSNPLGDDLTRHAAGA